MNSRGPISVSSLAIFISFVAILVFAWPASSLARDYESFGPISARIQNPVYIQNLWLTARRAEVLPEGTIEARIDSAYSNLFEKGSNATAAFNMDMELWRLAICAEYGLTRDLQIGIEIPLIETWGGFLDGFIQKFHSAFGFPNAGREMVPHNEFHYRFDANGANRFDYASTTPFGLGDITLRVKNQLAGEDSDWPALSWFADLKLPTGQKGRGLGSGAPDFGVGLALDTSWKRLHGYVNAAYYVNGGSAALDGFMNTQSFEFMVAGELTLLPTWSLIVQLQGGTPLLKGTGLDEWDGVPMDLVVGFRGEERDLVGEWGDLIWQFGFAEDVTSKGPSVDFTVYMSIGFRFDLFDRKRPAGDWLAARHEATQGPDGIASRADTE
ncbi:MAG: DUF3187 family protein [bacterium]